MKLKTIIPFIATLGCAGPAHASIFQGETLDAVANGIAWFALFFAPTVAIVVFWLVHILPEKIAEKRHHPQAKAIQTLCLLSLFFGGLLWPLAWLWAYSKPVMYKLAYGTDKLDPGQDDSPGPAQVNGQALEIDQLRKLVVDLETQLQAKTAERKGVA